MGAWICKCGERLKEFNPNTNNFYLGSYKEQSNLKIDRNKLYTYSQFWDFHEHNIVVQCNNCGRLWIDSDDSIVEENNIVKSLIGESNIVSFKPEPVFLDNSSDIMEELKRTADEADCEYELKYTNGKYTLKIDDKEISDESLSGVLQLLKHGKKY